MAIVSLLGKPPEVNATATDDMLRAKKAHLSLGPTHISGKTIDAVAGSTMVLDDTGIAQSVVNNVVVGGSRDGRLSGAKLS